MQSRQPPHFTQGIFPKTVGLGWHNSRVLTTRVSAPDLMPIPGNQIWVCGSLSASDKKVQVMMNPPWLFIYVKYIHELYQGGGSPHGLTHASRFNS